jgi:hypothetical protein
MKCEYHGQKKRICLHKDHKQPDVTYGYCYGICKDAKIIKKQKKQCDNCYWWETTHHLKNIWGSCKSKKFDKNFCFLYNITIHKTFKCKYYKRSKS